MSRPTRTLSIAIASLIAVAAPVAAQSPAASGGGAPPPPPPLPAGWTQVVLGLDSPRGIAVTADGTIYVAESGAGGKDNCITHPELGNLCFGPTGGVSKVTGGTATRIVDGVLSALDDRGETFGVSGVAVAGDGTVWYTVGGPAAGAADTRALIKGGEGIGQLYKIGADGKSTSVADFAAFESANNPDAAQPGNSLPDSNINGLALTADGGAVVTDAGGNDLLLVDSSGKISVLGVFPELMLPYTDPSASPGASPVTIPVDPVPTSVVIGSDGAYYVSLLTGAPFIKGAASVQKVVAGQDPAAFVTGLTNVMGVAFAPDGGLYVLEISENGLLSETGLPQGALLKVPAGGGTAEVLSSGLPMPGGIAVATDGTVYVSTCAVCPGGGGIASYKPAS